MSILQGESVRIFAARQLGCMLILSCHLFVLYAQENHASQLRHCGSELFDEGICLSEISRAEQAYHDHLAPDMIVVQLAAAYRDIEYVSAPGPAKEVWKRKG